jgi:hypothetical protein
MKPVLIPKKAQNELDCALAFYARARSELEDDLQVEFVRILHNIRLNPTSSPLFEGTQARYAILPRFPFSVIFLE